MTDLNHVAAERRELAKADWVKPEIVSFVPVVETRAQMKQGADANGNLS